ncbi:hypothetical protein BJ741DRAFT_365169 [Chytriomyces cf. hyalinus JEL632]|nr:hypothetical protein BJ741DRAFT_365169 [Chytriomyces cf. hyalinus JEL632]
MSSGSVNTNGMGARKKSPEPRPSTGSNAGPYTLNVSDSAGGSWTSYVPYGQFAQAGVDGTSAHQGGTPNSAMTPQQQQLAQMQYMQYMQMQQMNQYTQYNQYNQYNQMNQPAMHQPVPSRQQLYAHQQPQHHQQLQQQQPQIPPQNQYHGTNASHLTRAPQVSVNRQPQPQPVPTLISSVGSNKTKQSAHSKRSTSSASISAVSVHSFRGHRNDEDNVSISSNSSSKSFSGFITGIKRGFMKGLSNRSGSQRDSLTPLNRSSIPISPSADSRRGSDGARTGINAQQPVKGLYNLDHPMPQPPQANLQLRYPGPPPQVIYPNGTYGNNTAVGGMPGLPPQSNFPSTTTKEYPTSGPVNYPDFSLPPPTSVAASGQLQFPTPPPPGMMPPPSMMQQPPPLGMLPPPSMIHQLPPASLLPLPSMMHQPPYFSHSLPAQLILTHATAHQPSSQTENKRMDETASSSVKQNARVETSSSQLEGKKHLLKTKFSFDADESEAIEARPVVQLQTPPQEREVEHELRSIPTTVTAKEGGVNRTSVTLPALAPMSSFLDDFHAHLSEETASNQSPEVIVTGLKEPAQPVPATRPVGAYTTVGQNDEPTVKSTENVENAALDDFNAGSSSSNVFGTKSLDRIEADAALSGSFEEYRHRKGAANQLRLGTSDPKSPVRRVTSSTTLPHKLTHNLSTSPSATTGGFISRAHTTSLGKTAPRTKSTDDSENPTTKDYPNLISVPKTSSAFGTKSLDRSMGRPKKQRNQLPSSGNPSNNMLVEDVLLQNRDVSHLFWAAERSEVVADMHPVKLFADVVQQQGGDGMPNENELSAGGLLRKNSTLKRVVISADTVAMQEKMPAVAVIMAGDAPPLPNSTAAGTGFVAAEPEDTFIMMNPEMMSTLGGSLSRTRSFKQSHIVITAEGVTDVESGEQLPNSPDVTPPITSTLSGVSFVSHEVVDSNRDLNQKTGGNDHLVAVDSLAISVLPGDSPHVVHQTSQDSPTISPASTPTLPSVEVPTDDESGGKPKWNWLSGLVPNRPNSKGQIIPHPALAESPDSIDGSKLQMSDVSRPARSNLDRRPSIDTDDFAYPGQGSHFNGFPRFPLHLEKSIYQLSHAKLAQARRPLIHQVMISNLMLYILSVHADVTLHRQGPRKHRGGGKKKKSGKKKKRRNGAGMLGREDASDVSDIELQMYGNYHPSSIATAGPPLVALSAEQDHHQKHVEAKRKSNGSISSVESSGSWAGESDSDASSAVEGAAGRRGLFKSGKKSKGSRSSSKSSSDAGGGALNSMAMGLYRAMGRNLARKKSGASLNGTADDDDVPLAILVGKN